MRKVEARVEMKEQERWRKAMEEKDSLKDYNAWQSSRGSAGVQW